MSASESQYRSRTKVAKNPGAPTGALPTTGALADALRLLANPEQARFLQRFFKTGPGQYAAGDQFIGVRVPAVRKLVRQAAAISPREAQALVRSPVHEDRLAGLLLWVERFRKGDASSRRLILDLYLRNTKHINNWDLVDASASQILGASSAPEDLALLKSLASSDLLWERRMAVVATLHHIRQGIFDPTLRLCAQLLRDKHDLLHKACGWMLREVGKRDRPALTAFLDRYAGEMPRTMLRYALEHYSPAERRNYMTRPRVRTAEPGDELP